MNRIQYQITLCIIGAENIPDISTLGKMDLFAQIIYRNQNYKTCVLHDCGSCPCMCDVRYVYLKCGITTPILTENAVNSELKCKFKNVVVDV